MSNSTAITETAIALKYCWSQQAYDHFNLELLDGKLPDVMITLHRRAYSYGHFSVRGADAGHGADASRGAGATRDSQMRAAAQAQPETPAIAALTDSPTGGVDVPTG
jgi:hypothetical protein